MSVEAIPPSALIPPVPTANSSSSVVPGTSGPPVVSGGSGVQDVSAAAAVSPSSMGGGNGVSPNGGSSGASTHNPMAVKVNQEVLTSLHLIKDIRRLEKYQRDFFVKVKESLTHVHVLLDHQLMDMAWSDNLSDCEENLLKVSTHVQNTPSSQLHDVYSILLHDREKISARFQELSVKSSLSEFVVNSRQLLDIAAVRMAAEAILKNEKPIPAQGDQSIPVDHTFFLANFCTTSLASSMMASFVPKPPATSSSSNVNASSASPSVPTPTTLPPESVENFQNASSQPAAPSTNNLIYEKKVNGMGGQDESVNGEQSKPGGGGGEYPAPPTVPSLPPGVPPPPGVSASSVGGGNMYGEVVVDANANTAMDKYLQHAAAAAGITIEPVAPVPGATAVAASISSTAASTNGGCGHELVTAISQITQTPIPVPTAVTTVASPSPVQVSMSGSAGGKQTGSTQVVKATSGSTAVPSSAAAAQKKKLDPWGSKVADEQGVGGAPSSEELPSRDRYARTASGGSGGTPYKGVGGGGGPTIATTSSGGSANELSLPTDASSEAVTDDDEASCHDSKGGGDKPPPPLSFARIASLNIEKQAASQAAVISQAASLGHNRAAARGQLQPQMAQQQLLHAQQQLPKPGGGQVNLQAAQQQQQQPSIAQIQHQQQQIMAEVDAAVRAGQQQQQQMAAAGAPPSQQQLQQQQQSLQMAAAAGAAAAAGSQLQQQMSPPMGMAGAMMAAAAAGGPMMQAPPPHAARVHHPAALGQAAAYAQQHQQMQAMMQQAQQIPPSLPNTNNPRFFFDISMEGKRLGRVIIEVQSAVAPRMAMNFSMLVTGEKGFGYKGCQFFQAWRNESVICGDWEHNSGRGGRAALDGGPLFTPDDTRLPCIRGAVGMRRMSKKHSSLNQVASQFRIILANMNTQFTGIFGHIVSGIEALDKVADMGGEGGRPEKSAVVTNCGVYMQAKS